MKRSNKLNQYKFFMSLTEDERKVLSQKYFGLKKIDFSSADSFFRTYMRK